MQVSFQKKIYVRQFVNILLFGTAGSNSSYDDAQGERATITASITKISDIIPHFQLYLSQTCPRGPVPVQVGEMLRVTGCRAWNGCLTTRALDASYARSNGHSRTDATTADDVVASFATTAP
jgi:hypothetical protein